MIRHLLPFVAPLSLLATPAAAHPGHLGTMGGHDHWVLGIGIGIIAGAAVLGWLKGGKAEEAEDEAAEEEAEGAEEQKA